MFTPFKKFVRKASPSEQHSDEADRDLIVLFNEARTAEDQRYAAHAIRLRRGV